MWRIYMQHISDLQIGVRLQKLRESKGNNKTDLAIELNISTASMDVLRMERQLFQ